MFKRNVVIVAVLATLLLAGATTAVAKERAAAARHARGLKALGFKAYWSLLREDQRAAAKEIIADHLAATAPDRLAAVAHLARFKADVAALLTNEQRRAAGRLAWRARWMSAEDRRDWLDRLLDETDRAALAERAERHGTAAPAEKVTIGLEILDQAYAVVEPRLAEQLDLTREQRSRIRALYEEAKVDLQPVAVRLETAKAASVRAGLALLDAAQREKMGAFAASVKERVLAFLRG